MGVFGSVTALFIPLCKLSFLHVCSNITHLSVMHIISYANGVYFIAYVYNNYIVCSSERKIETGVVTPYGAHRGAGKGEGNFSCYP